MFQAQNRETVNSTWKVAVSFKIIMMTTVFHDTTPDLQDQDEEDHSVQDQDQDRFFWSQTGLDLRLTVSDHNTGDDAFGAPLKPHLRAWMYK